MKLAIRMAIALERAVAKHELDAVGIDAVPRWSTASTSCLVSVWID